MRSKAPGRDDTTMVAHWSSPVFLRWKGTIALTAASVFAAGMWLVLSAPPLFESRSTILVERAAALEQTPTPDDQRKAAETLQTERRVILSRKTAEAVAIELGLEYRESPVVGRVDAALERVGSFVGRSDTLSGREQWIERIARGLRVSANSDSDVLTVRYADHDPDIAKAVVGTAIQAYMNQRLGANAGSSLRGHYGQKLIDLQQRLTRLNSLLTQNSVTTIGENRSQLVLDSKALQGRIAELKGDLELRREGEGRGTSIARLRDEVMVVGSGLEQLEVHIDRLGTEVALTQNLGLLIGAIEQQFIDYQARFVAAVPEQGTVELINVEIIEPATNPVPGLRLGALHVLSVIAAALAAGILAAILRQFLSGQIRSAAQVEEILGLPAYGSVGKYDTR